MGGFKEKSVWHRRKCRLLCVILAIVITFDLVSSTAAQFYSETQRTVDKEKGCFCEVSREREKCDKQVAKRKNVVFFCCVVLDRMTEQ